MPTYNDNTNQPTLLPPGDYIFTVEEFECGISKGGKTSGSDKYDMKLKIESGQSTGIVRDNLIDHPSCNWKMDCFLKCCGVQIAKGESYEFRHDLSQANDVRWVNPIGLRGWANVIVEDYVTASGKPGKSNRVAIYYTDKEKLTPVGQVESDQLNDGF